jgi:hypothetical protein
LVTLVTSCTSCLSRYFLHIIISFLFLVSYIQVCLQPFCKQIPPLTTEALPSISQGCYNTQISVLSVPAGKHNRRHHNNPAHRPRNHTLYDIPISHNPEGSNKLPDDGRLLPKHVVASTYNKGCYKSVHIVGHF